MFVTPDLFVHRERVHLVSTSGVNLTLPDIFLTLPSDSERCLTIINVRIEKSPTLG